MQRREFLTRATALGLSAGAAYALGGLSQPLHAKPAIAQGGTLRIQQNVKPLSDPRSYDWSELGFWNILSNTKATAPLPACCSTIGR